MFSKCVVRIYTEFKIMKWYVVEMHLIGKRRHQIISPIRDSTIYNHNDIICITLR